MSNNQAPENNQGTSSNEDLRAVWQWASAEEAESRQKREMRRIGNVCLEAKEGGWTARLTTNTRGYCVEFNGPRGEMVCGLGWERSAERALYVAAERLQGWFGLNHRDTESTEKKL